MATETTIDYIIDYIIDNTIDYIIDYIMLLNAFDTFLISQH